MVVGRLLGWVAGCLLVGCVLYDWFPYMHPKIMYTKIMIGFDTPNNSLPSCMSGAIPCHSYTMTMPGPVDTLELLL